MLAVRIVGEGWQSISPASPLSPLHLPRQVRIFGEGWQSIGCEGAWHADSAGGAPNEPGWCDNPQFFVGLAEPPTSKAKKFYPPTAKPEEAATLYALLSQSDRHVERDEGDEKAGDIGRYREI